MHTDTFKQTTLIILSAMLVFAAGCKKDNSGKVSYDFSYTGSQYIGGTLHFTSTAPAGSTFLWKFGDSTTSSGNAPDHVYTIPGQFTVSLTVNGNTSNIARKTVYIGADSVHQAMISGVRMWHVEQSGYIPGDSTGFVTHYDDTSIPVYSVAPGAVAFRGDTLYCWGSTDSTINFSRTHYSDPAIIYSADAWSYLVYNFVQNNMVYTYEYHVSAGAGNWRYIYTSF